MTVFEIVVHRNVDSRSMALILPHQNMVQTAALTIGYNYWHDVSSTMYISQKRAHKYICKKYKVNPKTSVLHVSCYYVIYL